MRRWLPLLLPGLLLCSHAQAAEPAPAFGTQVMPIFSRAGCNSGACHGTFAGKNGFHLSLFGYEPDADHKRITRGVLGRRIDLTDPRNSLLLLKATGQAPHGGGRRVQPDSPAYRTLLRWIEGGARYDPDHEPTLERLEVTPTETLLELKENASQQLRVTAHFTDGRREDVTAGALYTSQDEGIARVDGDGRVTPLRSGDTFIIVGYLGQFARFHILVPNAQPLPTGDWKSSNYIDDAIHAKLRRLRIPPAALCDDATFLRRVMIDLCGTLPTPDEVRAFLTDRDPDKRAKKIDALLQRPEYSQWWASIFSDLTGNDNRYLGVYNWKTAYGWWKWLAVRLEHNEPYDEMVRNILLATSREGRSLAELSRWMEEEKPRLDDRTRWDVRLPEKKTLDAFWSKSSNRAPAVVAQEISHAFLGIRLECAQCHKHPFDRWTQEDFWGFAAFFTRVSFGYTREAADQTEKGKRPPFKEVFIANRADGWIPVKNPRTGEVMSPKPLVGPATPDEDGKDPREPLVKWLLAPENPYFARSIVNRIWAHHLGRGLIDPTDAMSAANPPSHPELLDALTRDFVAHRFDLKHLHRTILNSRAYQLSARTSAGNVDDHTNYSHYYVRRLPAEVLVDAIREVTGAPGNGKDILVPTGVRAIAYPLSRSSGQVRYAFRIFGRPLRAEICDCERDNRPSLPQSLYLMNDDEILTKIRTPKGRLAQLLAADKSDTEVIGELYLIALGRAPTARETEETLRHLAAWREAERNKDREIVRREAFEDVMWALLNVKEFATNH
jgi:hypothetical protein